MKKTVLSVLCAAAVVAACQPKESAERLREGEVLLTFSAEQPQTRTFIEETAGGWIPKWHAGDVCGFTYLKDGDYSANKSLTNTAQDGTTGIFTGKAELEDGNHVIHAYYPKDMRDGRSGSTFKFMLPSVQNIPNLDSFDPAADLLVSDPADITIAGGVITETGTLHFNRLMAVAKVVFEDATTGGKLSGKAIKGFTLKSSSGLLSGRVQVDITNASIVGWESKNSFYEVGVSYAGDDWTFDAGKGAYIVLNPTTLDAGSSLSASVITDDEDLSIFRSVGLKQSIAFVPGKINTLTFTITDENISEDGSEVNPGGAAELECTNPPAEGEVETDKLYGFAEAAGVTGGEGASAVNVLHFNNGKALQTWLLERTKTERKGDHSPVIIWLSGTFGPEDGRDFSDAHPWFDVKDVSNLSFYGTDDFVMDRIGIFCVRSSNIIIRNINFQQPKANNGADAVSMQECDGVWVDHCTFTSLNQTKDYEDGSCDITHGSKNVTVSWNRFIKTQKSCLVGHSNSQTSDTQITVTFHHNWFDNSSSRHPRVRFGWAHVYNNFYDGCTTYGAGSAYGAKVLVEYNCFDGVQLPTDICTYPAKEGDVSNLQGSVAGYLYATENVYYNRPAKARDPYPLTNVKYTSYGGATLATPLTYTDFQPGYNYVATPAEKVPELVSANAGYGKLGWTSAPVAVNNGGITDFNGSDGDDNDNPGTGETDDPDTPDQPAAGLSEGWYWINNGAASALYAVSGERLTIASSGKWESGAQAFGAVYREFTGDFTATVQLVSYDPTKDSNQAVAGIIIIDGSASASANDLPFAIVGNKYGNARLEAGKAKSGFTLGAPSGNGTTVLKMVREGNKVKLSYSLDGGENFGSVSSKEFTTLSDTIKLGVAANSGDNSKQSTAVFSNFTVNGELINF